MIDLILGATTLFLGGALIYTQLQLRTLRDTLQIQQGQIHWCTEMIGALQNQLPPVRLVTTSSGIKVEPDDES